MFYRISENMQARMTELEEIDRRDRADGTPRLQRLRQVPPETGKFLALLAVSTPKRGAMVEIGTSGGYSTMWLALAARESGRRVTTFEVLEEKATLARETFRLAGIEARVDLVLGDARETLERIEEISFCFLDAEKDVYGDIYEIVVPRLVRGGILAADNAINHAGELQPVLDRALSDARVDALVVPIGMGVLVCRKG